MSVYVGTVFNAVATAVKYTLGAGNLAGTASDDDVVVVVLSGGVPATSTRSFSLACMQIVSMLLFLNGTPLSLRTITSSLSVCLLWSFVYRSGFEREMMVAVAAAGMCRNSVWGVGEG